jgi:UDP-N-acetylglucosamine 2-epimerase (non-hydrolysing)
VPFRHRPVEILNSFPGRSSNVSPASPTRIAIVLGTRPEAIKLAPVVLAARARPELAVKVYNTGQHGDLCRDILALFGIATDAELEVMTERQTLTDLTTSVLQAMQRELVVHRPDWLLVQGDTTTAFASTLAAFYQKIPVAHVEAGLRTRNIYSPWPEEVNRSLITRIARLHFAPVASNAENLRREDVDPANIVVSGNTGIDALKWLARRLGEDTGLRSRAQAMLDATGVPCPPDAADRRIVLITAHRRESFGSGILAICHAIAKLAERFPDRQFVYPVHPNPAVRDTVFGELGSGRRYANVHLIEPLEYLPFIYLMSRAELILSDSGGVQEEAPSLGTRVIVMRDVTERAEGMETGLVRLAGSNQDRILRFATEALTGAWPTQRMGHDVYGDGRASERVVEAILARRKS